jgi:hypothetical protein
MRDQTLVAFRVERRAVTLCRYRGLVLEYSRKRELPAGLKGATESVEIFAQWACEHFSPDRIAIESDRRPTARRKAFVSVIAGVASRHGAPVWRIATATLFSAFGEPPMRSRAELRRVARRLWPTLGDDRLGRGALDAAAVGLLAQVQAILNEREAEGRRRGAA